MVEDIMAVTKIRSKNKQNVAREKAQRFRSACFAYVRGPGFDPWHYKTRNQEEKPRAKP